MPTFTVSQNMVMQGIFLGIIIAVLYVAYNKMVIGKFVRALIKAEAINPSFAKSFNQIEIKHGVMLKFALRRGSFLRKLVYELDDEELKGYYYIPEEKLYRAGRVYGGHDVDILMLAFVLIILIFTFSLVLMFVPSLLSRITDIF